eukprot:1159716-Pelagomonas_calceolata.AAC.4
MVLPACHALQQQVFMAGKHLCCSLVALASTEYRPLKPRLCSLRLPKNVLRQGRSNLLIWARQSVRQHVPVRPCFSPGPAQPISHKPGNTMNKHNILQAGYLA